MTLEGTENTAGRKESTSIYLIVPLLNSEDTEL